MFFAHFQNSTKIKMFVHKFMEQPYQGLFEVPHKTWGRSDQTVLRLYDTNGQTDKQSIYILGF